MHRVAEFEVVAPGGSSEPSRVVPSTARADSSGSSASAKSEDGLVFPLLEGFRSVVLPAVFPLARVDVFFFLPGWGPRALKYLNPRRQLVAEGNLDFGAGALQLRKAWHCSQGATVAWVGQQSGKDLVREARKARTKEG